MATEINREEFLGISFSHHMEILHKWDKYDLRVRLKSGMEIKPDAATNNFLQIMPIYNARKAVGMFKDEYLLDYINVEDTVTVD